MQNWAHGFCSSLSFLSWSCKAKPVPVVPNLNNNTCCTAHLRSSQGKMNSFGFDASSLGRLCTTSFKHLLEPTLLRHLHQSENLSLQNNSNCHALIRSGHQVFWESHRTSWKSLRKDTYSGQLKLDRPWAPANQQSVEVGTCKACFVRHSSLEHMQLERNPPRDPWKVCVTVHMMYMCK